MDNDAENRRGGCPFSSGAGVQGKPGQESSSAGGPVIFSGILSVGGRLLYAYCSISDSTGLEEVLGRLLEDMPWWTASPELPARLRAARERAALGVAERLPVELTREGRDGVPMELTLTPLLRKGEPIVASISVYAEEKLPGSTSADVVKESESRLRAVIETAVDAIITIDSFGTVRSFNPAAERLFGYTADEIIGRNVNILMPEPYRSEHDTYLENYVRTGVKKIIGIGREVEGQRKDGSRFAMELAVSESFVAGGRRLFTGIVRDITQRKQAEAELSVARDAALEASRAKSRFLATMSHELRTPLNAIIGYAELIGENLSEASIEMPLQAELLQDLARITASGHHLLALIDDVLDLSKIEAGRLEVSPEPVHVRSILQEVSQQFGHFFEKKGVAFCYHDPGNLTVMADRTRLRQVLMNLISNSLKFTDRGSVSVTVDAQENEIVLRITDTGIGMSADQIGKLFTEFTQLDASSTRRHGGTGLGLAITRRLVEMMRGHISVKSRPAAGTTFEVRLPAAEPSAPQTAG